MEMPVFNTTTAAPIMVAMAFAAGLVPAVLTAVVLTAVVLTFVLGKSRKSQGR